MDIAKKYNQKMSLIRIFNGWLCKTLVTVNTDNAAVLEA